MFIFPLHYYTNCVSTTLTVLILYNFESVYFFYSNPALRLMFYTLCQKILKNHTQATTSEIISFILLSEKLWGRSI
jgi:hypothetical protein